MNRTIHLHHDEGTTIDSSSWLSVMVTKDNLIEWCLDLAMLYTGVIDMLTVAEPRGKPYLGIRLDKRFSPADRGAAHLDSGVFQLAIGEHELLYWMTYYLGYVRDGMVGANHIDCDVPADDTGRLYVALQAADTAPPLTPDEARRLLDMS